ncbi:MAG TPA: ATP-dependent RNA helicase HrpA, partial [Mycobacteriales bacterium]|nr:ATP-dependent RNA helicase HrpA [Mycobacteriales bacterium]
MNPSTETFQDLLGQLSKLTLRDERRLRRKLDAADAIEDPAKRDAALTALAGLADEIAAGAARVERRRAAIGEIGYPEELPVTARREEIAAAIAEHQVVIVAGETGSGKTTQLPKICAELGRGVRGLIGHTQPRRLAARTVAERIAAELRVELGGAVGYAVRHTDRVSDDTRIKVMTDGILLAEIGRSPMLLGYDTIIIDEAHERSLNIDFLMGYLTRLLPQRPELKVIITSATIDSEKFAAHFDNAPIIEVTGRTYPVELRYRPMRDPDRKIDLDQIDAVCEAVDELVTEGPGDILAFFSGEREIRDAAEALRGRKLANTEVVPLFARLSAADQHKVFSPHPGRRIVLATNVAETSLTVPGVRYVIDTGTARISRFSNRTKVQRLPIEPISQASANQRAGRCGRVADGICIRLYTEADFDSRPAYTDPEILRTNLAAVLLRMISLGLGDIAAFPFLDPPDNRAVTAGLQLLEELGALRDGESNRLTKIGRSLARFPVDPRFGRMLLEADRNGCLGEAVIIVAGLSIQDPREEPPDRREAARAQHARFADPNSDFVSLLNLWNYLAELRGQLSGSAFRRRCGKEFLHHLRIREWEDLVSQLRRACTELGLGPGKPNAEPDPDRLHASLLAGLLSHIGLYDGTKREYAGARNTRFAIAPGSTLFRKSPRWVAAAELVETSRLWGRVAARIQPEWIEPLAEHLVKRQYSEPHWSRKRAAVLGHERVTLYGVPIVTQREVNYARVDPAVARDLFIR